MKIAIIGSRSLCLDNIESYLPDGITEIVSGGAKGIDTVAAAYAKQHGIPLTEFLPDYGRYGRGAPIKRNRDIANYADEAVAFWDGKSKGTMHTVGFFKNLGKKVTVIEISSKNH